MKKITIIVLAITAFMVSAVSAQNIWPNGATAEQIIAECSSKGGKTYRFNSKKLICAEPTTKKEIFLLEWRAPEQAVPDKNVDCNGAWKNFKICQK